jgi:hypothetical protein
MKQLTRKQFFKSFTGGLLVLGAVAMGKGVDKNKEVVVYADKIMPATGDTTIIGQSGDRNMLVITSASSSEPQWLEISGHDQYDNPVIERVEIPNDGSVAKSTNIWSHSK